MVAAFPSLGLAGLPITVGLPGQPLDLFLGAMQPGGGDDFHSQVELPFQIGDLEPTGVLERVGELRVQLDANRSGKALCGSGLDLTQHSGGQAAPRWRSGRSRRRSGRAGMCAPAAPAESVVD